MSEALLENLKSEEFLLEMGFLLPPAALRHRLQSMRQVRELQEAIAQGAIPEQAVREFVGSLTGSLRRGERFPHDLALAALAVALENRTTPFAEEYLRDLAGLKVAEMSVSRRVARECLDRRNPLAKAATGAYEFNPPPAPSSSDDLPRDPAAGKAPA